MTFSPEIGKAGGPQYDVGRAIKSFLDQMAEGNIDLGAAVIKELMQNADDALIPDLRPLEDVYVDARQLFRYFVICVEQGNEGEFGFFWDDVASPVGLFNFFDLDIGGAAGESFAFYDGSPIFWEAAVAALWRAVDDATAAGVGFEIIVDPTL